MKQIFTKVALLFLSVAAGDWEKDDRYAHYYDEVGIQKGYLTYDWDRVGTEQGRYPGL